MDVMKSVLENLNTWLVMVGTGVIVWGIRQIISEKIEKSKIWKTSLRIIPLLIGAGIACIPGLQPMQGNLIQSATIGLIGGSFATTAYELIREVVPNKIREMLGSPSSRTPVATEDKVDG